MTTFTQLFESPETAQFADLDAQLKGGQLDAALAALRNLQHKLPVDPRIFLYATRIALASGNSVAAREAAKQLRSQAADWPLAWVELADVLKQDQQYEVSLSFAKKVIAAEVATASDLFRAADCAAAAGDFEAVTDALNRAYQLEPDRIEILWYKARNELQIGAVDQARESFTTLLNALPENTAALAGLATAKFQSGELPSAGVDFETLAAKEPDNEAHQFFATLCKGELPALYPIALSESLFDRYARAYDKHMVGELKHRAPKEIAVMIGSDFHGRSADLLDLGCGTGLVSLYLGKHPGARVGVDISANMLNEAQRLKLYHRLHQVNLLDALIDTPADQYDAIVACDVFGYIAEIEQPLIGMRRILRPGGRIYATFELPTDETQQEMVNSGMRFCRSRERVETQYTAAGFTDIEVKNFVLRVEREQPVNGFIVKAQKQA